MKLKLIFSFLLLISFAIISSISLNCYTTFQHPTVYIEEDDSTGFYHAEEVSLIDDCSACHEQKSPYVESYSETYNDEIYEENYNWNYYFVTPWWFDESYYYDEPRLQVEKNRLEPTQRRDFDRRGSAPMPRNTMPRTDRPSLAKPSSNNSSSSSTTASQPKQRNERRQTIAPGNSKPNRSLAPPAKRESRESSKKETVGKKEKK